MLHLRQKQPADDPIRVPIVKLEKSSARNNHWILNVNDRIQFGVVGDILLHLTPQLEPNSVQVRGKVSQFLIVDAVEDLRILLVIVGCPRLEFRAAFFEILLYPLLQLVFRWLAISEFSHELIEVFQSFIRRLLELHVNERLRVIVDASHLNGVEEATVTVNFAAKQIMIY